MTDIHLVWSMSAAKSLRDAFGKDAVSCIKEYPAIGPLDDGRKRAAFFAHLAGEREADEDAFAIWEDLSHQFSTIPDLRIILWNSGNGADHVFMHMAAHFLAEADAEWLLVDVPPVDGYHSVALNRPELLLAAFPAAVAISQETLSGIRQVFPQIAADPSPLRFMNSEGKLCFGELSAYDDIICSFCRVDWKHAAFVLGSALRVADPLNQPDEMLLFSRLLHLVDSGMLEASGNMSEGIRTTYIRLAAHDDTALTQPRYSQPDQ